MEEDLVHRPRLHDAALFHHRHTGAELTHHMEVVGDEENGHSHLPVQPLQQGQYLGLNGDIQRRGGLVRQQQTGPATMAAAIITRWSIPPESSWGYLR